MYTLVHFADFHSKLKDCFVLDKQKQNSGKIKIPNLKFSQVYEATVKQIEEEAKLKAEKYEEGEISESTEEERSPTPSDISSSGKYNIKVTKHVMWCFQQISPTRKKLFTVEFMVRTQVWGRDNFSF